MKAWGEISHGQYTGTNISSVFLERHPTVYSVPRVSTLQISSIEDRGTSTKVEPGQKRRKAPKEVRARQSS